MALESSHVQSPADPNRDQEHISTGLMLLQKLRPGSLAVLNLMSFLDPTRIPREMLRRISESILKNENPASELTYNDVLLELLQRRLVWESPNGTDLGLHHLVPQTARARMQETETLEEYFGAAVHLIWTEFPRITRGGVGRAHQVDRWDRCALLIPHISRLSGHYLDFDDTGTRVRNKTQFADLLNEAGWYEFERANPSNACPLLNLAYSICEDIVDDCTEQKALILGSKTWISALTKESMASLRYAQERLDMEQQLFDERGVVTANLVAAYNDLGAAHTMSGQPSAAIQLLSLSKHLRETMPASKKEHNFSPLHELSLAYWYLGEYENAAKCLLEALQDREAALGKGDRQSVRTGQLFYALGNVRASQGLTDESFEWHQRALNHYHATAGYSHHKTAMACYRVAEHRMRRREYEPARSLINQALEVFQDCSCYQQEYARTLFLYASMLSETGEVPEGRRKLDRSVQAFNEAFPDAHRTVEDLTADDVKSLGTYDF